MTTEKIIIEDPTVIWQPTSFFTQWASSDEYNSSSTSGVIAQVLPVVIVR